MTAFLDELAAGREERKPVAAATLQRKAACLRSFYRHLRREGILDRTRPRTCARRASSSAAAGAQP